MIDAFRTPRMLSWLAIGGIGLDGAMGLLDALLGAAQLVSPGQAFDLEDGSGPMSVWFLLLGLIALAKFPVYVFSVVTFLMWLYRCYVNLPALRSDNMEFSPGWAVGWWFIPFANLVKPFQAVRTVWSESDPDFDPNFGFLSRTQAGAPAYMAIWWAAWLLSNFAANIAGNIFDPDRPSTFEISSWAFIVSGILTGFAALMAIKVIFEITNRQEQRFSNIGQTITATPPPPPRFDGQS